MPQKLVAFLSSEFSSADVGALRILIEAVSASGGWSRQPPEFIDQTSTVADGPPVRTVGVVLLVSAPNEDPPTPVSEPARIVDALAKFSKERSVEFELELDEDPVGTIVGGAPNRILREGLLERW